MDTNTLHKCRLGLLVPALLLFACGSPQPAEDLDSPGGPEEAVRAAGDAPGYSDVSPREFADRLQAGDDVLLVNVHVPFEGEIPGTDLHIPFNGLDEHLERLPAALDAPVALYCMGDGMSLIAADALAERGYTNLIRLEGGMVAWGGAGFSLEGN